VTTATSADATTARTVDFWSVHCYVAPALVAAREWPMLGTLEWQHLADADPAKLAALLDAAQHHALRIETAQAALAEASSAIASAADWQSIARTIRAPHSTYIPREKAS
jgi:hypothetical protein